MVGDSFTLLNMTYLIYYLVFCAFIFVYGMYDIKTKTGSVTIGDLLLVLAVSTTPIINIFVLFQILFQIFDNINFRKFFNKELF